MNSKAEKALAIAKTLEMGDGWFEVVALPNDIFALKENGHIQEVSSFFDHWFSKGVAF